MHTYRENGKKRAFGILLGFVLIMGLIAAAMPVSLMAQPDNEYNQNEDDQQANQRIATQASDTLLIQFSPSPGTFPTSEASSGGIRTVPRGQRITDVPPDPFLEGYVFEGWRLDETPLDFDTFIPENHEVIYPIWVAQSESNQQQQQTPSDPDNDDDENEETPPGEATPTPAPTPSPSPTPGAQTPSPSPVSPQPNNPQTSPMAISFLIFGAVMTLGIATFSIIKLAEKQKLAEGQYRTDAARYEREARLADMLENND